MSYGFIQQLQVFSRRRPLVLGAALALIGAGVYGFLQYSAAHKPSHSEVSSQSRKGGQQRYKPLPAEWASLTIQPCSE